MGNIRNRGSGLRLLGVIITLILLMQGIKPYSTLYVHATADELAAEAEERKDDPVESNEVANWPQGPAIGAAGAILMDADSGAVLYAKGIYTRQFPASITKIMCCLVAIENCPLDEMITVNQSAINANEPDGSNMGLVAGEQLSLQDLLYGILISSANEACNVIAEHIAGSIDGYVDMMNRRAISLGCVNTHFVTTNGLHNEDHYTCAYDMALIARAFFSHDILCRISSTSDHYLPATATHNEHYLHSKNKLYEGAEYAYSGLVGSKTGFTSHARQTLVSCAERDGMRLIAVILREESPAQFTDTVELFDYGFSNFSKINVSGLETRYLSDYADFFHSDSGLFGSTSSVIDIDRSASIILPDTISFEETDSKISYEGLDEGALAKIAYSYNGVDLGYASLLLNSGLLTDVNFEVRNADGSVVENSTFQTSVSGQDSISVGSISADSTRSVSLDESGLPSPASAKDPDQPVFVNVYHMIGVILGIVVGLVILLFVISGIRRSLQRSRRRRHGRRRRRSVTLTPSRPGGMANSAYPNGRPGSHRRRRPSNANRSSRRPTRRKNTAASGASHRPSGSSPHRPPQGNTQRKNTAPGRNSVSNMRTIQPKNRKPDD